MIKELADSFAQFAAMILLLITLAVSTAAVAQWAGGTADGAAQAQTLAADAGR